MFWQRRPARQRDVTILATGSEVAWPSRQRGLLAKDGDRGRRRVDAVLGAVRAASPLPIATRCWATAPRVAVEAAVEQGWERWLGERGTFVGMTGFGASAPAPRLYEHFGITPAKIVEAARKLVV